MLVRLLCLSAVRMFGWLDFGARRVVAHKHGSGRGLPRDVRSGRCRAHAQRCGVGVDEAGPFVDGRGVWAGGDVCRAVCKLVRR